MINLANAQRMSSEVEGTAKFAEMRERKKS